MQLGEAWEEAAAAASIVVSLFFICQSEHAQVHDQALNAEVLAEQFQQLHTVVCA